MLESIFCIFFSTWGGIRLIFFRRLYDNIGYPIYILVFVFVAVIAKGGELWRGCEFTTKIIVSNQESATPETKRERSSDGLMVPIHSVNRVLVCTQLRPIGTALLTLPP